MCQPKLFDFPSCGIKYEYTRLSNPTSTLRETGVNRFQPICLNPQDRDRWEVQGEVGINYRMIVKDNHTPLIPSILSDVPLFPSTSGNNLIPCELIAPSCAAYTAPLNYYRLLEEGPGFSGYRASQ
jgi:hypothetical protein